MCLKPLKRQKFDHNFQDTIDPICHSGDGIEDTEHFLLHCTMFQHERDALIQKLSAIIGTDFEVMPDKKKLNILLYEPESLKIDQHKDILKNYIEYIKKIKHFDA